MLARNIAVALAFAPLLHGQDSAPLLMTGDMVGPQEVVLNIVFPVIDFRGNWMAQGSTSHPTFGRRDVLFRNGVVVQRAGDAVAGLPDERFGRAIPRLAPGSEFALIHYLKQDGPWLGPWALTLDGEPLAATGRGLGTPNYPGASWFGGKALPLTLNAQGQALIDSHVDGPSGFEPLIGIVSGSTTRIVARRGDILPGQVLPVWDSPPVHSLGLDGAGRPFFGVRLGTAGPVESAAYLGGTLIAESGGATPLTGYTWVAISSSSMTLAEDGRWALAAVATDGSKVGDLLVRDGAVLVEPREVLADVSPHAIKEIVFQDHALTEGGELLWRGEWGDEFSIGAGLFIDRDLLAGPGDLTTGGSPLIGISPQGYGISSSGRYVIFKGKLEDGSVGMFEIDRAVGQSYCGPGAPNSAGTRGALEAIGSVEVARDHLVLCGLGLPTHQLASLLVARDTDFLPGYAGSAGNLCLGGAVYTLNQAPLNTGATGLTAMRVDLTDFPRGHHVAAGETWHFQLWYRDLDASTSNFTDAVSVTFQ